MHNILKIPKTRILKEIALLNNSWKLNETIQTYIKNNSYLISSSNINSLLYYISNLNSQGITDINIGEFYKNKYLYYKNKYLILQKYIEDIKSVFPR